MWFLISIVIVIILITNYVLWFREWLKTRPWPWSQRYFEWIEPIEIKLWKKSETILWSRFLIVIGLLMPALEQFQLLNTPVLVELLPDNWERYAPLLFTLCGIIQEILRRYTATPLDVVALPTVGNTPEVNAAVANLTVAKAEAVEAVEIQRAKIP